MGSWKHGLDILLETDTHEPVRSSIEIGACTPHNLSLSSDTLNEIADAYRQDQSFFDKNPVKIVKHNGLSITLDGDHRMYACMSQGLHIYPAAEIYDFADEKDRLALSEMAYNNFIDSMANQMCCTRQRIMDLGVDIVDDIGSFLNNDQIYKMLKIQAAYGKMTYSDLIRDEFVRTKDELDKLYSERARMVATNASFDGS